MKTHGQHLACVQCGYSVLVFTMDAGIRPTKSSSEVIDAVAFNFKTFVANATTDVVREIAMLRRFARGSCYSVICNRIA